MSDRVSKILIVVLLTLLIWMWAYWSQEQVDTLSGSLETATAQDDSLLVTFTLPNSDFSLRKVPLGTLNFKGPPSAITDLKRRTGLLPNNPERENLTFYYTPPSGQPEGTYTLDLLDYLQKHPKMHELALSLESCNPEYVEVHIEKLEKKKLPIQPLDEKDVPIYKGVMLEPPFVTMFARPSNQAANITLTQQDMSAARKAPISIVPYVDLGVADIVRFADEPVRVSLLEEDKKEQLTFQTPKPIGVLMSPELRSQYKVTILNEDIIRETTTILATDEALKAYENVAYPFYVEIKKSDLTDLSQPIEKIVTYNFPPEFVRRGEIEKDPTKTIPKTAKLKIEPVNPTIVP